MPRKKKKRKVTDDLSVTEELPDPDALIIIIDGQQRKFTDYTREFTIVHYPEIRHKPIVVPPISFHQTWLCIDKDKTQQLSNCSSLVKVVSVNTDSERRSSAAEYVVAEGFKHFARSLGQPCAIILGHKYENYLSRVKKQHLRNVNLPSDVLHMGSHRGEHDLLFLFPPLGVLVVSVKSVGGNFQELKISRDEQENILKKTLAKAVKQQETEVKVVGHVLGDLSPPVLPVIALPNIDRKFLIDVLMENDYKKQRFLCSDDLSPLMPAGDTEEQTSGLIKWFQRCFPAKDNEPPALTLDQYEDVVGRYCGFLSIVDVHHRHSEGRIEVRALPEAITEVNRRFRSLLLLPEQAGLLCSERYKRVYLFGMLGSGKTVMLMLKARQWLASGYDVIIINVSYDVNGSPMGHALLRDIEEDAEERGGAGQVAMVSVRLAEFHASAFLQAVGNKLEELAYGPDTPDEESSSGGGQPRPVCFILDEVYPSFQPVFKVITDSFPESEVWAAGLERRNAPQDFDCCQELTKVLRCPPCVQKVLSCTDYDQKRVEGYTICGASEGLPSEGPPPKFIFHQHHRQPIRRRSSPTSSVVSDGTSASELSCSAEINPYSFMADYSPLFCEECAVEVCQFLQKEVGLCPQASSLSASAPPATSTSSESSSALKAETGGEEGCSRVFGGDEKSAYVTADDKSSPKKKWKTSHSGVSPATACPQQQQQQQKQHQQRLLSQKDVVILVKDPESMRIYPEVDGIYKLNTERFSQFVSLLDQSVFTSKMRSLGYSLRTVKDASSEDLVRNERDEITVTWVNPVSGLEWAVVLFMPGDPPETGPTAPETGPTAPETGQTAPETGPTAPETGPKAPTADDAGTCTPGVMAEHPDNVAADPSLAEGEPKSAGAREWAESLTRLGADHVEIERGLRAVTQHMSRRDREYLFWGGSRCSAQLIVIVP